MPDVITAITAVANDMPGIGKDLRASQQQGGYAYRGIEKISQEAAPLFAKHGVLFTPRVVSWETRELVVNGKPWTDERLMVEYTVYGPGGKEDFITVGPIAAIGRDNSDKGCNKALTQAFKYALIQTLCIADSKDDADGSTHEADARSNPEADMPRYRAAPLARVQAVQAALNEYPTDMVKAWKEEKAFPWPWSDESCNWIEEWMQDNPLSAPGSAERVSVPGSAATAEPAGSESGPDSLPLPGAEDDGLDRLKAPALLALVKEHALTDAEGKPIVGGTRALFLDVLRKAGVRHVEAAA